MDNFHDWQMVVEYIDGGKVVPIIEAKMAQQAFFGWKAIEMVNENVENIYVLNPFY